jgi:lytic murein transglycosylase
MTDRSFHWAVAGIAMGLILIACESTRVASTPETAPIATAPGAPPSEPGVVTPPFVSAFNFHSSGDATFDAWREAFAAKARATGKQDATIISVLDDLTPLDQSVQTAAFDNQAEFVKPIWDYAKSAVSPTRISNGQAKLADNLVIFSLVEATYGAPREVVAAVWGMESSYGAVLGNTDAPRALATQAAIGRRKDFNEAELLAIMTGIERGLATRDQYRRGSWAGALGQTQFMPSTLLTYGRDYDLDGHTDIWTNTGDALASTGYYLEKYGWKIGEPWAIETTIPEGFDYSLGDGRKQSVAAWKALGLSPATKAIFAHSEDLQAELFLPAGSYGPAFLLFENFGVIKKYNNADSYALAVGLLADRLVGGSDTSRPWPTDIVMLTQQQAKDLQSGLNKLNYSAGTVDGIIGRGTRGALQKFQKDKGLIADGFPTTDMLDKVTAAANLIPAKGFRWRKLLVSPSRNPT